MAVCVCVRVCACVCACVCVGEMDVFAAKQTGHTCVCEHLSDLLFIILGLLACLFLLLLLLLLDLFLLVVGSGNGENDLFHGTGKIRVKFKGLFGSD